MDECPIFELKMEQSTFKGMPSKKIVAMEIFSFQLFRPGFTLMHVF